MTKAEAYDKAWRLGARGDFSLVDQIYHSDYRTGIDANIEDEKNDYSNITRRSSSRATRSNLQK